MDRPLVYIVNKWIMKMKKVVNMIKMKSTVLRLGHQEIKDDAGGLRIESLNKAMCLVLDARFVERKSL